MTKKHLLLGSNLQGILRGSQMLLSEENEGKKTGEQILTPNNYNSQNEEVFVEKLDKDDKTGRRSSLSE
ncbi:hypothetical protein, partial [Enterococcus faecium]|uniref:hypothetical protein n=1 Tax=Enterococcus faecium TaxID=1352 RepID=UPI0030C7B00E